MFHDGRSVVVFANVARYRPPAGDPLPACSADRGTSTWRRLRGSADDVPSSASPACADPVAGSVAEVGFVRVGPLVTAAASATFGNASLGEPSLYGCIRGQRVHADAAAWRPTTGRTSDVNSVPRCAELCGAGLWCAHRRRRREVRRHRFDGEALCSRIRKLAGPIPPPRAEIVSGGQVRSSFGAPAPRCACRR